MDMAGGSPPPMMERPPGAVPRRPEDGLRAASGFGWSFFGGVLVGEGMTYP